MRRNILIMFVSLLGVFGINRYILFFKNIDSSRITIGRSGRCGEMSGYVSYPSSHSRITTSETISKLCIAESIFFEWLSIGTDCFQVVKINPQYAVLLKKREVAAKYWVKTSARDVRLHKISALILETTDPPDGNVLGWKMIEYSDSGELLQKTPSLLDYALYKIQKAFEFPSAVGG